jgi:hypothetical protein
MLQPSKCSIITYIAKGGGRGRNIGGEDISILDITIILSLNITNISNFTSKITCYGTV